MFGSRSLAALPSQPAQYSTTAATQMYTHTVRPTSLFGAVQTCDRNRNAVEATECKIQCRPRGIQEINTMEPDRNPKHYPDSIDAQLLEKYFIPHVRVP